MRSFCLLLALFAAASAHCDSSHLKGVSDCYKTYMAGFNITMADKSLPEYWVFHDVRMGWLNAQGLNAQPAVCKLGLDLATCLKPFTCLAMNDYESLGASNNTEASDYWIDLAVTQYQCGDGYDILMTDFYCMGACRDANEAALDACQTTFNHDIPRKGLCKAQQSFLNCQTQILQKCCDWNSGVFMCMSTLTGFNAVAPLCYDANMVSCPNKRTLVELMRTFKMRRMHGAF